jgi:hypothetical protein
MRIMPGQLCMYRIPGTGTAVEYGYTSAIPFPFVTPAEGDSGLSPDLSSGKAVCTFSSLPCRVGGGAFPPRRLRAVMSP